MQQTLIQIYQAIPSSLWIIILGGTTVSFVGRLLKHLFGVNSGKVMTVLVSTLSFVAPALQFLLSSQGNNIFSVVPHAAEIMAVATTVYNLLIKDGKFDRFLKQVQEFQSTKVDAAVIPVVDEPAQNTNEFQV